MSKKSASNATKITPFYPVHLLLGIGSDGNRGFNAQVVASNNLCEPLFPFNSRAGGMVEAYPSLSDRDNFCPSNCSRWSVKWSN